MKATQIIDVAISEVAGKKEGKNNYGARCARAMTGPMYATSEHGIMTMIRGWARVPGSILR